jgi:hypothetical protein
MLEIYAHGVLAMNSTKKSGREKWIFIFFDTFANLLVIPKRLPPSSFNNSSHSKRAKHVTVPKQLSAKNVFFIIINTNAVLGRKDFRVELGAARHKSFPEQVASQLIAPKAIF